MFNTFKNFQEQMQQLQDHNQELQQQNQKLRDQVQQLQQQLQNQQTELIELRKIKQECDRLSKLLENDAIERFEEILQISQNEDQVQENIIKRPSTPQPEQKLLKKKSFESI